MDNSGSLIRNTYTKIAHFGATIYELSQWALRKRRLWRVKGDSMAPYFCEGDLVSAKTLRARSATKTGLPATQGEQNLPATLIGEIVLAKHPHEDLTIIKLVTTSPKKLADNQIWLWSPRGNNSSTFGPVETQNVRAIVTHSFSRVKSNGYRR